MEAVFLAIGIFVGGVAVAFVQHYRFASQKRLSSDEAQSLITTKASFESRSQILQGENERLQSQLLSERTKVITLTEEAATQRTERANLQAKLNEHKKELEELQGQFTTEFENLANRIFEEKSEKFSKQNKESLNEILGPLNKEIGEFKKKVEDTYVNETRDRVALKEQIETLAKLNTQMSEEATSLTKALKGDSQVQGIWGELRLETVLGKVGLERGQEYLYQESYKTEDGRLQPDVIVNLPGRKHFVIDAKVSLTAYERYCRCDDVEEKKKLLQEHLLSLRSHVARLSAKDYQSLYQITSPDYVFMFIAVEPAFNLAIQNDPDLFTASFEKGVVLVTPCTLLVTLRTVENIWRQEKHNKNALEIAQRSGDLYDKFALFAEQLVRLGDHLRKTQDCYTDTVNKLKDGKGNIIRRIEDIKKLGAKARKTMPVELLDETAEDSLLLEGVSESISDQDGR